LSFHEGQLGGVPLLALHCCPTLFGFAHDLVHIMDDPTTTHAVSPFGPPLPFGASNAINFSQ